VVAFNSSPARKLKKSASEAGRLIDGTQGRKTRSLLVMDSGHVILCSIDRETLGQRLSRKAK